jgi:thiol-disulfide isomerase/thioredoxin
MNPQTKTATLIVALVLIGGAIYVLEGGKATPPPQAANGVSADINLQTIQKDLENTTSSNTQTTTTKKAYIPREEKNHPLAKEITDPQGFINTAPLTIKSLIGKKVILVDFWTYSCINCQRTIPYLNAWYQKYKDQGLEIIGMHTPEFDFEKDHKNVATAVQGYGIKYPVVLDSNYGTWYAYQNQYWPRKYLIDINGYIVYDHIGEGAYDETESEIQSLLKQREEALGTTNTIASGMVTPALPSMDLSKVGTRETYFGAARNDYLGNGARGTVGDQTLTTPSTIEKNVLYLGGSWHFEQEYAAPTAAGAKIILRYSAKNVYLVAGGDNVPITITRDGKPLGDAAGKDVVNQNGESDAVISGQRLYKLIEDPSLYGEHTIEITVQKPGLQVFTFTFG